MLSFLSEKVGLLAASLAHETIGRLAHLLALVSELLVALGIKLTVNIFVQSRLLRRREGVHVSIVV